MFHRLIEPEDKKKLSKIIEIIQNSLENEGYNPERYLAEKILLDAGGTPINGMKFFVSKADTNYRIEVQMLQS